MNEIDTCITILINRHVRLKNAKSLRRRPGGVNGELFQSELFLSSYFWQGQALNVECKLLNVE